MVASAYAAYMASCAADFGVTTDGGVSVDLRRVKERKDAISGTSRVGTEKWLKQMENCTVCEGHGRLESPRLVSVGQERITADRIFVNGGGRAAVAPMPGLEHVTKAGAVQKELNRAHLQEEIAGGVVLPGVQLVRGHHIRMS